MRTPPPGASYGGGGIATAAENVKHEQAASKVTETAGVRAADLEARRATDGRESITRLVPGVCIDIPLGTAFQYRCTGDVPLVFTCTALPPWPGDDEAVIMDGPCGTT